MMTENNSTSSSSSFPASYELVLLVKPEVFVYRIPPLSGNKGYKANDWNLGTPDWTGRLRLISISDKLEVRLEDKATGQLFAKALIGAVNSIEFEPVTDSSRYFVIRLRNDNGQTAFVGIGFADRSDSFDLQVAVQDHFKTVNKCSEKEGEEAEAAPKLDLSFKQGQTITVNIGKKTITSNNLVSKEQNSATVGAGATANANASPFVPLLPPPPSSGNRIRKC